VDCIVSRTEKFPFWSELMGRCDSMLDLNFLRCFVVFMRVFGRLGEIIEFTVGLFEAIVVINVLPQDVIFLLFKQCLICFVKSCLLSLFRFRKEFFSVQLIILIFLLNLIFYLSVCFLFEQVLFMCCFKKQIHSLGHLFQCIN
jgi:hypothetical protein